jgi:Tol biopolymer transport system component
MAELLERLSAALAGRYAIERELGRGGMAVVYLAEDLRHHRRVAVKVLLPDLAATLGGERFLREIETTAQLTHPHILPLLDSGEANGALYYVMPFVEGESLRDRLEREKRLPVNDAVQIAREAADALSYAHSHGVIHRDIKPENILLESGHAVVADFGIARAVSAAGGTRLTETGISVGTPAYMSPEQAAGGQELDGRSDVYSLGCVLYEMLSGETPYTGPTPLAILAKKLSEPLPRVSLAQQNVAASLEAVLTKVLASTPDDRFATAGEFAAALGGERFKPLVTADARRRRRRFAVGGLVVLVAAGAFTLLSRYFGGSRGSGPVSAGVTQLTSEPGVELYPSLSPDGKWIVYAGDQSGNLDIYLRAVGGENAINLTKDSPADDDQPVFSADGERIAFRSGREGGGIFVMGRTGEAVRRVTHIGFRPTWSPDGRQLAFVTEDVPLIPQNMFGLSELWVADVNSGALRHLNAGDAALPSWSPHGYRIAYTKRQGLPMQADVWTIPAQGGEPVAVTNDRFTDWNPAWSPDGKYLYFVSDRGGSMNLWRVPIDERSGRTLGKFEPITVPTPNLTQISVAAEGHEIAYSSVTVAINIQTAMLDPTSGTVVGNPTWVTNGSRQWSSPDPSRDGQWVTFYSIARGDIYVAHPDGTGLRQVTGDSAGDRVPRWSPDGNWIAFFSSRGGKIQIWRIRPDGSELRQLTDADNNLSYAVWSPDGTRMAASRGVPASGSTSFVFDPNQPWTSQVPQGLPAPDTALLPYYMNSWSPDGRRLCGSIGPRDNGILTYDLGTHRYERLTDFGEWPVWLPDGRHILFVSGGKRFYIVDRETKQVRRIFTVARDVVGPPRLTRDGHRVFYSRRVTEADLWLVTLR